MRGAALLLLVLAASAAAGNRPAALSTADIAQREGPSVVLVQVLNKAGQPRGQASGVVVREGGVIVTNFHVLDGACEVRVQRSGAAVDLPVVGLLRADKGLDLAIVRVGSQTQFLSPGVFMELKRLRPAALRGTAQLRVGDRVIAIGNPRGLEQSVSEGIVAGFRAFGGIRLLQITAPISPGSSGGGVFDARGRLIGITTFTLRESQNLNFAVPVDAVNALLRTSMREASEVPWSTAKEQFCHDAPAGIDAAALAALLGKGEFDPEVQATMEALGGGTIPTPKVSVYPAEKFSGAQLGPTEIRYYRFGDAGIGLYFGNNQLWGIRLEGERVSSVDGEVNWKPFAGALPFSISWRAKRSAAARLLGAPVERNGDAPGSAQNILIGLDAYVVGHLEYTLWFATVVGAEPKMKEGELVQILIRRKLP